MNDSKMAKIFGNVLIIDSNNLFVQKVKDCQNLLEKYPCVYAKSLSEASKILKMSKYQVRAIFLSKSIGTSKGVDELREIRKIKPDIPVFLVSHEKKGAQPEVLNPELGFHGLIQAPNSFEEFVVELNKTFTRESWNDISATAEEKFKELTAPDDAYIPTSIVDFSYTEKSFFNLFIKLSPSKFIKIVNAGDPVQESLLEKYLEKGFTDLYIREEEHKKYLTFCDELSKKIVKKQDVSNTKKVINVLNLGANVSKSIILKGITSEKMDFANSFLNQSVSLMRSMRMQHTSLKKLLDIIESNDHSSTVAFLAGLVANEVGFESTKSVKVVGLAALMHDIGLYDLDPNFKEEKLEFTPQEAEIFANHSRHGASILRKLGNFDEVVCQAVEQHHMRRRGNDPAKRQSNINLVTEIIGVSDVLHHLILRDEKDTECWKNFFETELKNFSPQIEKAVIKILNKDK